MIGYTTVGTNDLPRAVAFYDALFDSVGIGQLVKFERGVGWGPSFAVMTPINGQPATVGNGPMIGLSVTTTDEGEPGPRGGGFYGAYFRDLDGNKLAAFCTM